MPTKLKRALPKSYFSLNKTQTGFGVFAKSFIPKGRYVIEYKGKTLNNQQADEKAGMYLFEINARKTLDGSGRSNFARYINHSCRPNCEPDIVRGRVFIVAKKNIKPGEQITYDYGKEHFDYFIKPKGCKCDFCLKKNDRRRIISNTSSL